MVKDEGYGWMALPMLRENFLSLPFKLEGVNIACVAV